MTSEQTALDSSSPQFTSDLVERALRLAARCHRDQHRKGSDLPYITHPIGVVLILMQAGFHDDQLLATALLHDVVEDTAYTTEQLATEFPSTVVDAVHHLTERKLDEQDNKRSWQDRKNEHLSQIEQAPLDVRAIVLADKLHNLSSMLYDLEAGEDVWSRFGASPERVLWYHREMVARALGEAPSLIPLANACRGLISRLDSMLSPQTNLNAPPQRADTAVVSPETGSN